MPTSTQARPAQRAHRRPLAGTIAAAFPRPRQSHKLTPMTCVLWLRDHRAYLRAVDLAARRVSTTPDPHEALRLAEDQAELIGQDLIDATGFRVELRPYYSQAQVA